MDPLDGSASHASFLASPHRTVKHTTYFPVYDRLFSRFRGQPITFLEIGVLGGGSLFMWRDYFGPQARIIGVELNPAAAKWREHGFEIFIGSQSDPEFWAEVMAEVGEVDIVLDDGGHRFQQQIITYESLLPFVRDGGMLVVEDTHTSYIRNFGGPSPTSFVSYAKDIVNGLHHRSSVVHLEPPETEVWSVRFFDSIVAFEVDRSLARHGSKPIDNGGSDDAAETFNRRDPVEPDRYDLVERFRYGTFDETPHYTGPSRPPDRRNNGQR